MTKTLFFFKDDDSNKLSIHIFIKILIFNFEDFFNAIISLF